MMPIQEIITKPENKSVVKQERPVSDRSSRPPTKGHLIPDGHIASLDVGRFIASFFIVLGHCGPFYVSGDYSGNAFLAPFVYVFFHIRNMGLPFFLMTSGFLFGKSLNKGKLVIPRYTKAFSRLSKIFLAWSLIYVIEPIGNSNLRQDLFTFKMLRHYYWQFVDTAKEPLLIILEGTRYHLWFLPALLFSLSAIVFFIIAKKQRYLIFVAITMFIISQCLHQEPIKTYVEAVDHFQLFRSYCQSLSFVTFGWWFSQKNCFLMKDAIKLFAVALFVQIAQDLTLLHFYGLKPNNFMSIGLLPAIFGVFIMIMCYPGFGRNSIFDRAGKMTLGIYVMHPLIISTLRLLDRKIMHLDVVIKDFLFPGIVIFICLYLTKFLSNNTLLKKFVR